VALSHDAAPASPTREYICCGGALLAKFEAGTTNYYHADHLSVRTTTDASGYLVSQQAHYLNGKTCYQGSGGTT